MTVNFQNSSCPSGSGPGVPTLSEILNVTYESCGSVGVGVSEYDYWLDMGEKGP